jgi:thioredoxin 1
MAEANVVHVTAENWQSEVIDSQTPVLVDFWAPWCGPCKAIAPELEKVASELTGRLKVAKVNVDEAPDLAGQFGIRSIPTLLIMKSGNVQQQMVGAMSATALKAKVEPFLSA